MLVRCVLMIELVLHETGQLAELGDRLLDQHPELIELVDVGLARQRRSASCLELCDQRSEVGGGTAGAVGRTGRGRDGVAAARGRELRVEARRGG